MKPLTVGSTFTGIGGADLGFEWAGFDIKWQCEFDSWKQQVLRAHWPDVPLYDDITTMSEAPSVDVMIGGFPCQDLSVAGRRKGFSGERSVLAFEFLRVAESLQPRWIVLENVPGLLSSNNGRDFARLIDEVVGCGYGVAWRILDARYFGVPQRRRRVFIVARRTDAKHDSRSASRLALRALFESGSGDTSSGWQAWTETTRSVGSSSPSGSGIAGSLTKRYAKGINTTCDDGAMVIETQQVAQNEIAGTLDAHYYKGPGSRQGGEREYVAEILNIDGGATGLLRVPQVEEGSEHD
jgi:DNA-cytosine methyltransferase